MHRLWILLLCLGPILGAAPPAHAETRLALVIGNGAYADIRALPNPPNDARAIAGRLRELGFDVTLLLDAAKRTMDEALRTFGRRPADVAMIFYAGHGVQVDDRNYLVPVDAHLPQVVQDLRYDFVDMAAVMDELAGARRLRIVVLDACRDNPISRQLSRSLGRSLGGERGLAAPADSDNTLIAYATAADATAAGGEDTHSPYTRALLAHLGDPGVDIRLMFGRVRDDVRRSTNNQQNPFTYESLGGDSFAFNTGRADLLPAPAPRPVSPIPPPPPPLMPPPAAGLEQRALSFIRDYWATWSADDGTAMAFIARAYAPTVDFHGKPMPRTAIVQAKQAYLLRWPVRAYRPRLATSTVTCEPATLVCTISGVVDWDSQSPARNARSTGSAAFSLRVAFGSSDPTILGENGSVLTRSAGP